MEDSLVSTVGLLSGVAAASISKETILLTGVILIFVEAFSMAVGSFLSEHSVEDYIAQRETSAITPFWGGVVMFISYFVAGFIPLFPYALFEVLPALWLSISLSLISLLVLGLVGARFAKVNIWKGGLRMFLIGGVAILIGVVVGRFLSF